MARRMGVCTCEMQAMRLLVRKRAKLEHHEVKGYRLFCGPAGWRIKGRSGAFLSHSDTRTLRGYQSILDRCCKSRVGPGKLLSNPFSSVKWAISYVMIYLEG